MGDVSGCLIPSGGTVWEGHRTFRRKYTTRGGLWGFIARPVHPIPALSASSVWTQNRELSSCSSSVWTQHRELSSCSCLQTFVASHCVCSTLMHIILLELSKFSSTFFFFFKTVSLHSTKSNWTPFTGGDKAYRATGSSLRGMYNTANKV